MWTPRAGMTIHYSKQYREGTSISAHAHATNRRTPRHTKKLFFFTFIQHNVQEVPFSCTVLLLYCTALYSDVHPSSLTSLCDYCSPLRKQQ